MRAWCIACIVVAATTARADDRDRAKQLYDDGLG
jgi:hypothetical protein